MKSIQGAWPMANRPRRTRALYNGVRNGGRGRRPPAPHGSSIFLIMHRYDY